MGPRLRYSTCTYLSIAMGEFSPTAKASTCLPKSRNITLPVHTHRGPCTEVRISTRDKNNMHVQILEACTIMSFESVPVAIRRVALPNLRTWRSGDCPALGTPNRSNEGSGGIRPPQHTGNMFGSRTGRDWVFRMGFVRAGDGEEL